MNPIKLTEEHKSKLLEMCNKLFPGYDFTLDKWTQCFVTLGSKSKNLYEEHIHWFEFCLTYLIVELSKEFTKQGLSESDYTNNQYPNWFSEKLTYHLNPFRNEEFKKDILFIHPVDYLYEEFKKLK